MTVVIAAPARAQDSDTAIEQVPTRSTNVDDTAATNRSVATQQAGLGTAPGAIQLTPVSQGRERAPQLTVEPRQARSPEQLYRGGKTAQPSEPLSRPSEGRTAAVARVFGDDRCNHPQTDPAVVAACARAIENRAAEFSRTEAPELSAEQRLLVDQRLRQVPMNARNAARRLAEDGAPDTLEGQSVASIALQPPPGDPRVPAAGEPALSAETQAVIGALVGAITNTPPPAPQ